MEDDIKYLKSYIDKKLKDKDGGNWEYIYRPEIRYLIDNFNKQESEKFNAEIPNWSEEIKYILADEIIFSENKYLDKDYMYCEIFSKTENAEYGEYLLQNFTSIFKDLDPKKCSIEFVEKLRDKVIQFSKISITESIEFDKLYEEKLAEIKNYC